MDSPLVERERAALHELVRLASERAKAEAETEAGFRARKEAIETELQEARQRIGTGLESESSAAEHEYQLVRHQTTRRYEAERQVTEKEYATVRKRLTAEFDEERERAEKKHQETSWSVTTVYEANKTRMEEHYQEVRTKTEVGLRRIDEIEKQAVQLLEDARQDTDFEKTPADAHPDAKEDPLRAIKDLLATATDHRDELKELPLLQLFSGERYIGYAVGVWFASIVLIAAVLGGLVLLHKIDVYPSGWPVGWYLWLIGDSMAVGLGAVIVRLGLAVRLQRQLAGIYPPLRQALAEAAILCQSCRAQTEAEYPRLLEDNRRKRERDLRSVDEKYTRKVLEMQDRYAHDIKLAEEKYPRLLAEAKKRFDQEIHEAEQKYPRLLDEIRTRFEDEARQVQQTYNCQTADNDHRYHEEWDALAARWRQGLARVQAQVAELQEECGRLFPAWEGIDAGDWPPPVSVPGGMRFGEVQVRMEQVPDAVPPDERLADARPGDFLLPALVPFPHNGSVLLKASDAGRNQAVLTLQALMLRFLTSLPPGKVRFTIVDPVGLGENFASFMHLADYQEALVTNRIWTEPQHIEQRLADLTEHMENVIQKYLRNEFATLEEYNTKAGEVAEPYRVLVVANFPVNFNEAAARRLLSIAGSGARSGVYTLVSVDTKLPLPQGFNLKDLEQVSLNLTPPISRRKVSRE